jgi:hypothetical protein
VYLSNEWWNRYLDAQRDWEVANILSLRLLELADDSPASLTKAELAQRDLQRLYKRWRDIAEPG